LFECPFLPPPKLDLREGANSAAPPWFPVASEKQWFLLPDPNYLSEKFPGHRGATGKLS
jgi:hypothetical protein